jgi:hypothetical protein
LKSRNKSAPKKRIASFFLDSPISSSSLFQSVGFYLLLFNFSSFSEMDLFFECARANQRLFVDVSESSKVSAVQELIKEMLELDALPDLKVLTDDYKPEGNFLNTNTALGYTKDSDKALAHKPGKLAFFLPGDEEFFIQPLSTPKPIPQELKGDEPMPDANQQPGPSGTDNA